MKQLARPAFRAAVLALVAAPAVATAAIAAADEPFLTVSGTVHCVNQTYTLTVPRIKIQSGTTSYYFLDGPNLTTATTVGSEQPLEPGKDATAAWTPATPGSHNLYFRGSASGSAFVIGPQAVDVSDATSPACLAGNSGSTNPGAH
ncbi:MULTISPECIES: hypothetical protein [unclassified Nocardia]|uniref:hypothetical protein n=1 Tax=unclassified Nocardia TaxID=2637762 RepID=UPI001CE49BD5|nr:MULTISPECIES: hypothetical protein [unclassified Nocardia]